ncbi:SDR family NAD(P)-dependent oxidoreductase [Colwellia sp. 12G3]|uniref:SDR family NAD(P)-dependent oxidoreductase n=1 Tax=Colwellia sp. 12G3 TaxID=2058299 RepID=UPI001E65A155|nr:SDR family NAD(P)-dependent oxidoreductase [Colwellia sp. 12G3]
MSQHKDKVAVITGAASGIGQALAIKLAKQGCHLALVDRNLSGLMEVQQHVEQLGVRCIIQVLDVADNNAFKIFPS